MRKAFALILCATIVAVAAVLLGQQAPHADMTSASLDQLNFLLGDWKGSGWMEMRPGQRSTMNVKEKVTKKVGGHALLVEGLGTIDVPGQDEPRVVHDAMGVVWIDQETGKLQFESWLANGMHGVHEAEAKDGVFTWRMNIPQAGHIRYTIQLNDKGQWHEIGERSSDEETWSQFFEMTLDRVGEAQPAEPKGDS